MEILLGFVEGFTVLTLVKVLLVLLLGVYAVFAGLMMKQINAMTRVVTMKDDYIIRLIGVVHCGFAIIVFLMAVFIL